MQAINTVQYETLEMSLIRGKIKEEGKKTKTQNKERQKTGKRGAFFFKKSFVAL